MTTDEKDTLETTKQKTSTIMSNAGWEQFAKGDLMNFLVLHNLQKVSVDDGAGKKASVKINSKGEYNISYTSSEVM